MVRQANNLGLWRTGRPVESSIAAAVAPDAPILVRPESIRRDGGTQMRAALDAATVHEYHELIRDAGGVWPFRDPVRLVHDGAVYWLVDGFHRLQAWTMHYSDPAPAVPAVVVSGDQRAAGAVAVGSAPAAPSLETFPVMPAALPDELPAFAPPPPPAIPPDVAAVFVEFHAGGVLRRGGRAAAIRALAGDVAGGRAYQQAADEVDRLFGAWLSTRAAAPILKMRASAGG